MLFDSGIIHKKHATFIASIADLGVGFQGYQDVWTTYWLHTSLTYRKELSQI